MNIEFSGLTLDFATKTITGFLNAPYFTLEGLKKISNKVTNEPIFIADYKDLATATYVSGTGALTLSALPSGYSASNNTDVFVATYSDLDVTTSTDGQTGPTVSYSVSSITSTANYLVPNGTNTIIARIRNGATGLNITPQFSTDATPSTWNSLVQRRRDTLGTPVAGATGSITNQGIFELDVAGLQGMNVRLNVTALTSGSCIIDFTPFSSLPTQVGIASMPSITANIGTSGISTFSDSATNLASNATFTGTSRDSGTSPAHNLFVANVFADQPGTLRVEKSTDNSIWRLSAPAVAVSAGVPVEVVIRNTTRYNRVVYVNGATAQTQFLLTTAYQRI